MKRTIYLILGFAMIFASCKKKSDDNTTSNWSAEDQAYYNSLIALQEKASDNYSTWSKTMDSLDAINKLKQFFLDDPSVSSATIGNQGIAVQYTNGIRGGIFLNPRDNPEDSMSLMKLYRKQDYSSPGIKSLVNNKKMLFFNPTNFERHKFSIDITNALNVSLKKVGYQLSGYVNWLADLDKLCNLKGYGIIQVYSHGWAWPSEESLLEVYMMTGEVAKSSTSEKYWKDLINGSLTINLTKTMFGEKNVYWVNKRFIANHNDFSKDTVLFYGGFCYSFLGSWPNLQSSFANGAYFGFDWYVETSWNSKWSISLMNTLCDTAVIKPSNSQDWFEGSYPKSYVNKEGKSVQIFYFGDLELCLWNVELPTLTTSPVTEIKSTSSVSGGNILTGSKISAKGVCWSISHNPTIADNKTNNGAGQANFTSAITGLSPSTPYFVRAYATNAQGTGYGNEQTFTTPSSTCAELLKFNGKTYSTIQIGTQCWFKENLNIVTGNSWCYKDSIDNCDTYGRLYDWQTALGVCPAGSHLPSDAEWTILSSFLGGQTIAGGKMKETGSIHWALPNTGATNSSGFTALPGGNRLEGGDFIFARTQASFWSSTEWSSVTTNAWRRFLNSDSESLQREPASKGNGASVRCLKN